MNRTAATNDRRPGDPPRLLYLLDYEPRGTRTVDDFILAFARRMTRDGWELVFGFAREPSPAFACELAAAGARHLVVRIPFTWRSAWRLVRD